MGQPTSGTGELLAVLAVRPTELAAELVEGDTNAVRFAVRMQMAAIDSLTGESVQMDTVRRFVRRGDGARRDAWVSFCDQDARSGPGLARCGCRLSRTTTGEACSARPSTPPVPASQ